MRRVKNFTIGLQPSRSIDRSSTEKNSTDLQKLWMFDFDRSSQYLPPRRRLVVWGKAETRKSLRHQRRLRIFTPNLQDLFAHSKTVSTDQFQDLGFQNLERAVVCSGGPITKSYEAAKKNARVFRLSRVNCFICVC